MKNLMTLCFAVLLGLVAAGLNFVWMSGLATPSTYVGIDSDLPYGYEITADELIAIPVPGDAERLTKSLIPYANRAILYGTLTSRNYAAGDIVFQRDIQSPQTQSNWEVIGPFKLISVGERFKQSSNEGNEFARTAGNNVTIAVDANFGEQTRRLLEVINADYFNDDDGSGRGGIMEVQVLADQSVRSKNAIPETDMVHQTISLEGVANVPSVLLEGNMIRFVVPAAPIY